MTAFTGVFEALQSFALYGAKGVKVVRFPGGTQTLHLIEDLSVRILWQKRGEVVGVQLSDIYKKTADFFSWFTSGAVQVAGEEGVFGQAQLIGYLKGLKRSHAARAVECFTPSSHIDFDQCDLLPWDIFAKMMQILEKFGEMLRGEPEHFVLFVAAAIGGIIGSVAVFVAVLGVGNAVVVVIGVGRIWGAVSVGVQIWVYRLRVCGFVRCGFVGCAGFFGGGGFLGGGFFRCHF